MKKLLVANRGEIARRIFRTAQAMGIASVAVYSDADAQALHVREAGQSYALQGNASTDTYLRIDKLLAAMHGVFTIDQLPLTISPSIGIALYPEHGHSADQLLRCANAAMHHAKESGRGNRQFYDPSMDASALDVLRHERLLREARPDYGWLSEESPDDPARLAELWSPAHEADYPRRQG